MIKYLCLPNSNERLSRQYFKRCTFGFLWLTLNYPISKNPQNTPGK